MLFGRTKRTGQFLHADVVGFHVAVYVASSVYYLQSLQNLHAQIERKRKKFIARKNTRTHELHQGLASVLHVYFGNLVCQF